jgi:deoxyadenosine/deoxycytidine kinase
MLTSIPHPQILFIDGLPGSGKSMAAETVGGSVSDSRVFVETAPDHPLLVGTPDRMEQRSQTFTRYTLRVRLPLQRSES